MGEKKKILFVAMQMSIHTTRWINQLDRNKYDIHLFPINEAPAHPELNDITIHYPLSVSSFKQMVRCFIFYLKAKLRFLKGGTKYSYLFTRIKDNAWYKIVEPDSQISTLYGPQMLNKLIRKLKPDLIHSLEFQHCGYKVLYAKQLFVKKKFPKWWATNWGSDVYFYRQYPQHLNVIRNLLKNIDYYSCECKRDLQIVHSLGYQGTSFPIMPNTGGVDIENAKHLRNQLTPSKRKLIMIKGYESFAGRALLALEAIQACADLLNDYEIIVYSVVTSDVMQKVQEMASSMSIRVLPHTNSHQKMLEFFSQARIYLGVSRSDGISTSLLESMAMGAFPIQTNTACCEEWFQDGKSGISISPNDPKEISAALRKALTDDVLVDKAFDINWRKIEEKADKKKCSEQANSFYECIFNDRERENYGTAAV